MTLLDKLAKQNGFESAEELNHLVSYVDLSEPAKVVAFIDWKENDGSKEGLLRLPQCAKYPTEQTSKL